MNITFSSADEEPVLWGVQESIVVACYFRIFGEFENKFLKSDLGYGLASVL